ncbi:winged helix-turn-helix transcriptional regulator [Mucilaginibacter lappiensis]|uniref:winged helix-turn-helix transcriptional regulator n=1 Tax=Mucilaginibacter lappiensis TaxID=354630 RepID=UPI003D1A2518
MIKPMELSAHCREQMQAVQDTMDVMGGKWKIKILAILYFEGTHFMELQRRVNGIGSKMLAQELKDLEMNGLVNRTVVDSRPVMVKYELTPYGTTLKDLIEQMETWGRNHRKKIIAEEKIKSLQQPAS